MRISRKCLCTRTKEVLRGGKSIETHKRKNHNSQPKTTTRKSPSQTCVSPAQKAKQTAKSNQNTTKRERSLIWSARAFAVTFSYACSSGASDGLLLAGIISWMTNSRVKIYLLTDSSGARGILQRQEVGRVRHLSCRILWLQEYINSDQIKLSTVAGSCNPADIGTRRLPCARLRSLMCLLGMYNLKEQVGLALSE